MQQCTSNRPLSMILALFVTAALPGVTARAVTLVEDGRARCAIVVPREENVVMDAARDLQYHLRKMSGAEVPLVHNPSDVDARNDVGIYIDTKPLDVHVPGRLIDRSMLWPDGYVIELIEFDGRTGVFLSSPVPEGVSNAVYGLLEDHLRCHWFTIGPEGEHIPRRRTVKLDIPGRRDVARPDFEKRSPWYNEDGIRALTREQIPHMVRWYRRNRSGGLMGHSGHAWGQIFTRQVMNEVDEDGDGVSDLAVFFDGRRRPEVEGLCMSNPKAVEIASRHLIQFFNDHPYHDFASFFQPNIAEWCRCDECLAMGSNDGARMLILSNRVAENVAGVHPTKRIMIGPSKNTREPPEEPIQGHPNLFAVVDSLLQVDHIQPKTADNPWNRNYRRQVEGWMKGLPAAWRHDYIGRPNGPWPMFHALQETHDFYRRLGYTGVQDKYLSRNMGTDVYLWLTLRMAWDSRVRVADLLEEFYPAYFGTGAEDMRWIYEQLEQHMRSAESDGSMLDAARIYPLRLLDACLARIAEARQKAAGDEAVLVRIERDQNCLKATRLWVRFCLALAGVTSDDRREATRTCRAYLEFVRSLDGKMTLGGIAEDIAERMHKALTGPGTYFAESRDGQPWPGPLRYYDGLDWGGKTFDAKSRSGFHIGLYGLYLAPGATGEIVYDMRLAKGLRFKDVHLPGAPGGTDLAIRLALPKGGHNGIEVSLDQGRTWAIAYKDLETRGDVIKYDLAKQVDGSNRFLLKFWVQNTADQEILAMDSWTLMGTAEPADDHETEATERKE